MNNSLITLAILIALSSCQQVTISTQCTCAQMLTSTDCGRQNNCLWDAIKKACTVPQTTPTAVTYTTYCDEFTASTDCSKDYHCAWNGTGCTHFTACTSYTYADDTKCKQVSARCITDGVHCVEIDACSTYKTNQACVLNASKKYCYWNTSDATNPKCEDADDCFKLPKTLTTDVQCRQVTKCTTTAAGGCVESGLKCSDQIDSQGCVTSKDQNQACFWASGKCVDKTCDNALTSLTTDESCKNYLSTCTTKQGGGCVTRTTCTGAIEKACVKDNTGADCFWNGSACVNKICANALTSNKTNASCQTYLSKCITTGAGCVDNTGCEAAKLKDACEKTLTNQQCHWDGTYCKLKICANAGSLVVGHDQCTAYLNTCTANGATGCTDRTCANAPISNDTNDLCNQYLPNGKCITKNGGGCRINTTCEEIDKDTACLIDANGSACIWDGSCKAKTCANSPVSNNSHSLCQQFLQTCTVGTDNKCVDMTCENVVEEADCKLDFNNQPCIYKKKCYKKQCSAAAKTITTYSACQTFSPTCTLDNSGAGCMELPQRCEVITKKEACYLKAGGGKCGILGSNCVDQTCATAPTDGTLTTTLLCDGYRSKCVVNNNLDGCMDLPTTCGARQKAENCEVETTAKCQWDGTGNACIDIKCENAHIVTLKNNVNQGGCWSYQDLKCVVNTDGNMCAARPASCAGLSETACKQDGVVVGDKDCYWDAPSSLCKDYTCSSITFAQGTTPTHADCYNAQDSCTINAVTPTGCIALKDCNQYTFEGQCKKDANGNDCVYDSVAKTCSDKPCGNADDADAFSDYSGCQTFSKKCTVIQQKCTIKKATCAEYLNSAACAMHTISKKQQCTWNSGTKACENAASFDCTKVTGLQLTKGQCAQIKEYCTTINGGTCARIDCTAATVPYDLAGFDLASCQSYHPFCAVKLDGTGCVDMVATCAATNVANCTKSLEGLCYPTSTPSCQVATTPLTTCTDISGKVNLTADYCKGISNNACSVLANQTGCVAKQDTCSGYTLANCFSAITESKCVLNSAGTACVAFDSTINTCGEIKINGLTNTYSDYLCRQFKFCTPTSDKTGCQNYSGTRPFEPITDCTTVQYPGLSFQYCQNRATFCSVNAAKDSCVLAKNTCAEYTATDCVQALNEGECILSGTAPNQTCVQKSCDGAALTITNMDGCQKYSSNCVLRAGGCSARSTCASYLLESACVKDSLGNDCLWNTTTLTCVDKTCTAAEASTNYNTHDKCSAIGSCTVKANTDKTVGLGCIARAACSTYVNFEQCKLNNATPTPGECAWNENNSANKFCADKSCTTAPLTKVSHSDCIAYLAGCTVNVVNVNGTKTAQGCTLFKPCSQYEEAQCVTSGEKDSNNIAIVCGWNRTTKSCANISCVTAPSNKTTPILCAGYLAGCTVNTTNDGCMATPDKCEGMTLEQCYDGSADSRGRKCYYVDTTIGCITRTCDNSPNYSTDSDCSTYLAGCTTDAFKHKCKTKICEDFELPTDAQCKDALGICTTNGTNCVVRATCGQAQFEAGCVTDSNGKLCQWMAPANQIAYCTIRTCATAPSTLTTEEQCKQYFTPTSGSCTTKKDGGCTLKGACTAATVEAACNTDSTGADCWWDTDKCRPKECKDFSGSTHSACQKFRINCTAGLNGKCALMANCEATTVRAACIVGTNGPCLWVNDYANADGSMGGCFKYDSCKSLTWPQDNKCKWISPNCTTDGTQCVGITSCAETNINGGCKTGTDGQCIQTVSAKGTNDTICKKYSSCDAAYYLTHDECYSANPNCTSDYTNGCITLAACSTYTKQGQCNFNKDGTIKDVNGYITSTGNCVWDTTGNACRDEQCKDIALTTEWECSARLKTCSTDGTTCIVKGACNTYLTNNACNKAGGTEGDCFWVVAVDTTPASCRTKTCADIPNGTSTAACSGVTNCVSNGTNCIAKVACTAYTTKTGCMSSGTDGQCVWTDPVAPSTQGKCQLMTGCASAKDSDTCNQVANRCTWNTTTKACEVQTCEIYKTKIGSCKYFYTWDMKNYNICSINKDGKCVASEPSTLAEGDCLQLSAYQYSWNPTQTKCVQCGTVISDSNNSNSTTNNTNVPTTEYGCILAWSSAVLFFIVI